MFATANWYLAVVQGTLRSWLPLGLSSPAIRPMANAGEVPKFLRWGHGRPLSESLVAFSALGLEPSLQWLLRNIIRLLAGWSFVRNGPKTRFVQRLLRKPK